MHDTMKKPRHKTPSAAKRARSASGADEGDRHDKGRWSSRRKTNVVTRPPTPQSSSAASLANGVLWLLDTAGKLQQYTTRHERTSRTSEAVDLRIRW